MEKTILFATSNENKKREVQELLHNQYIVQSLSDLHFEDEIPEPFNTLEENAQYKAAQLYRALNLPCFAEDTGLEVFSLGNAPGVKSARYAGEQRSTEDNISLLLRNLEPHTDRSARFRTVLAYCDGTTSFLFEGIVEGTIGKIKRGTGGFGYDPVFMPMGYDCSFAEMDKATKNKISHRGIAIQKFIKYLQSSK
ncbi:MAG: RdgB/HAM1 family non-canonical purine NTP pyrophosphatase [Bacteroidetes bacterium]|nr:RdgB/HAM1 family non-canonical purine NTP pyrophosphatase [Bacteroidota bacterium]